jgi:RNA polymerase sigma-70 factor (ECF subfamily)
MNPADRECVERIQAGDQAALADLYDRYAALLHPLALRITGDAASADEVLFETWMQVVRRSVPFEPRRSVAATLLSVVRTRALERRQGGAKPEAANKAGDSGPIEVSPERMELADRAAEALGPFDATELEALELAFYDGLTQTEIALRHSVSVTEIQKLTRQGLERLQAATPKQEAA